MKVFRSAIATGLLAVLAGVAVGPNAQAADTSAARTTGTIATTVAAAQALTATPLILSVPSTVVTNHSLRITVYSRAKAPVTVYLLQFYGPASRYTGVTDAVGRFTMTAPARYSGHVSAVVAADPTHAAASTTVSYRASALVAVTMTGYYRSSAGVLYYRPTTTKSATMVVQTTPQRPFHVVARLQYHDAKGWHYTGTAATFLTTTSGTLALFTRGLSVGRLYRAVVSTVADGANSSSPLVTGTPFMFK